jgi:hypothetical protein
MGDHEIGALVPPGCQFDVVWRGYHRRQVREFLDTELRMVVSDRDAAVGMVYELARLLEESKAEIGCLRERLNRLYRAPLTPEVVDARLRSIVDLAHQQAAAIVAKARATAEHVRMASLERVRRQEEDAELRRRRIEDDFRIAMAARRTESIRALHEHEAICRAEAERLLYDAEASAQRRIRSATLQVNALRETHRRLAHRLRTVRGLLVRACGLVDSDGV